MKKTYIFFHFSLLFPVLFPPLCFPIVVPVVLPRCTTPLLGRSPRANRCENWWLRTCAHLQKIVQTKSVIFIFSFDLHTDIILRQFNFKEYIHFFSLFSAVSRFVSPVVLPYCGPRCIAPLHYPVVGSKSSSQPLRKLMTYNLCPSS